MCDQDYHEQEELDPVPERGSPGERIRMFFSQDTIKVCACVITGALVFGCGFAYGGIYTQSVQKYAIIEEQEVPMSDTTLSSTPAIAQPQPVDTPNDVVSNAYLLDISSGLEPLDPSCASRNTRLINNGIAMAKSQGINEIRIVGDFYVESGGWTNRYLSPVTEQHITENSDSLNYGITLPSNTVLDLTGATLRLLSNSNVGSNLINICYADNVIIRGGILIGDRTTHIYTDADGGTHEWGFGVLVASSTNVTISNMVISEMAGDGICLIDFDNEKDNVNVTIRHNTIYNCRRQGVSVASGVNTLIEGNHIYNIGGTEPGFGIDIEMEGNARADGTVVRNNAFSECEGGAILCHSGYNYSVVNNYCGSLNIVAIMCGNVTIAGNHMEAAHIAINRLAENITASVPDETKATVYR